MTRLLLARLVGLNACLAARSSPRSRSLDSEVLVDSRRVTSIGVELVHSTPTETLDHCPGVSIDRHGTTLNVHFIRSPLDEPGPVDTLAPRDDGLRSPAAERREE